jgi:hypothetical protein
MDAGIRSQLVEIVEAPDVPDLPESRAHNFEDPLYEWRRLLSEALGTFLLVDVVGTITGVSPSRPAAATAPVHIVIAVILIMGRVSGAHLNPGSSLTQCAPNERPHRVGAQRLRPSIVRLQPERSNRSREWRVPRTPLTSRRCGRS